MPTIGAHAFIWIPDWNPESGRSAIESAGRAGVELLEIPLLRPQEFDPALTKQQLADNGIRATCSLGLPKAAHMPSHPQEAADFLHFALDKVAALGAHFLSGVLYAHLGYLTGAPPTQQERDTCARVLGEVAAYARSLGIALGIEPVNRYETYLFNTVKDTLALIDATGAGNAYVHADTYHMNIEEAGFRQAILDAGSRLAYIHMSESDRGVPGQGNVHWDEVFQGLAEIDYRGPLVLESFAAVNPDLAGATCMWRNPSYTSDQLAREGVAFLREGAARVGLP
ncbi:MAG: sugar phosphate isomerase/epimerase family protein [Chloroflexia bacterium]